MGLFEGQMARTLGRRVISTRQEKLAELARVEPKLKLTAPAHHPDEGWLREAHRHTRKDGAAGVDGVSGYSRDHRSDRPRLVYGPVKTGPVGPAVWSETGRRDDRTREALEGGLPLQNFPDLLAYLTTLSAVELWQEAAPEHRGSKLSALTPLRTRAFELLGIKPHPAPPPGDATATARLCRVATLSGVVVSRSIVPNGPAGDCFPSNPIDIGMI